jgi:selenocysteine lyase/cysteine desulfurase
MHAFPIDWVRSQFPSLELSLDRRAAIFLDAPGGTQVPIGVTRAVRDYYRKHNSNVGGRFVTSKNTAKSSTKRGLRWLILFTPTGPKRLSSART